MTNHIDGSARETGEILTELVAKARETFNVGGSRRQFFAKTAKLAGATVLGGAGIGLLQPLAATAARASTMPSDTAQDIFNIAATAECLATTFYFHALIDGKALHLVNENIRNYFQAAMVQEYVHLEILQNLGATPLTTKFYFPVDMFTDPTVFFPTASTLEDYFISAYLAAAMEFSGAVSSGITVANPTAIGLCVQIAGVECEHRALLNVTTGLNPPNNRLIESALLTSVGGAVAPLTPFLSPGSSGFSPTHYLLPSMAKVDALAQPYGFSSFPSYTIA